MLVVFCQKVIPFLVSGEKSKHRWNNVHTMAEAKAGLQALLKMVSFHLRLVFTSDGVGVGVVVGVIRVLMT